ncbi:hypothetical protein QFZ51_002297 [Chitinophaga sp. W3I9]
MEIYDSLKQALIKKGCRSKDLQPFFITSWLNYSTQ